MNSNLTKKDVLIIIGCVVFLMINLGAVGSAGRQKAMESVCLSNLKQWGDVFQMWLADHDNTFPPGRHKWFYSLRTYYGASLKTDETRREYKIRFCPTAIGFADEGAKQPFAAWRVGDPAGGYIDPMEPWTRYYWDGSYGTNSWIYSEVSYAQAWKNANVANKNQIPLLLDSALFGGRPNSTDIPPAYAGDIQGAGVTGAFMRQFCIDRHNGAVNAVFMDFSARSVGLKKLWTLKWHRSYNTCGPWTKCGGVNLNYWPEWMRGFKNY